MEQYSADLAKSLIAAQAEMKAVPKDAKGYNYTYQTLDDILNMARPVLARHGLVMLQQVTAATPGHVAIRTTLMHETGAAIADVAEIPIPTGKGMNEAQQAGSAITYLRRYSAAAILGVVSDKDDDGGGNVAGNGQKQEPTPPAQLLGANKALMINVHEIGTMLYGKEWESKRTDMSAAFGVTSSKDWTVEQAQRVLKGMAAKLAEAVKLAEKKQEPLLDAVDVSDGAYSGTA